MKLAGQAASAKATAGNGEQGYAMAALLVGISVMAVLMGMALPVWSHMVKREKEEELIWRGNQYVRAIRLFQTKFANTFPPTIDVLVDQRFLRKKYKDPITDGDFEPVPAGAGGMPLQNQIPGQPGRGGTAALPPATGGAPSRSTMSSPTQAVTPGGSIGLGIGGVRSKSNKASIKIYNGRQKYNEWVFIHLVTAQRVGAPGGGQQFPGMPTQPGAPPGMRVPGSPGGPGGPGTFNPPGRGGMPPMMPGGRPPVPFGQPGQPPFGQPPFQPPFGGRGQPSVPQRPPGN
jgi:type II secretory pathway pseudopilin PulG